MNDDEYRSHLDALEAGKLEPMDIGYQDLCKEAGRRVEAACAPLEYVAAAENAIPEYYSRLVEWPRNREHCERVASAAERLADALRDSGKSRYFQVIDDDVWLRAAGESFERQALAEGYMWPPSMPIVGCSLEPYLRALAAIVREDAQEPEQFAWLEGAVPKKRESRNLGRFVIRRIRWHVDHLADRATDRDLQLITQEWRPRKRDEFTAEANRAAIGNNVVTARLATIILCEEVTPNDVSKAVGAVHQQE